jgi:hypothetical protein
LGTLRNPPNETPRDDHLLVELRTRLVAGTLREGEPIEPPRLTLRRAGGQPLPVETVDPEGQHPVLGQPHIKIISLGKQAGGFQFLVTNEARDQAATAGPVRIDLELPGNLEFVSATASEGRLTARTHAGQVQLGLDRLVPGQSSIITLETTPSPEAAATAPETGDSGDSGANQPGSGRDSNGEDLG